MGYLTLVDGKLACIHPAVKEIKDFGSGSATPNTTLAYNIEFTTTAGKAYRETSDNPDLVYERVEKILQTL